MADLNAGIRNDSFVVSRVAPSWPWKGSDALYDPTKVGEIERDAATGCRRYQIRRTPTTNAEESPWFYNAKELDTWLTINGLNTNEKWNLSVALPSTVTLHLVEYSRTGGKRIYRLCHSSDGSKFRTSDWLLDAAHLEVWLSNHVALLWSTPQHNSRPPAELPIPPSSDLERLETAKKISAAPEAIAAVQAENNAMEKFDEWRKVDEWRKAVDESGALTLIHQSSSVRTYSYIGRYCIEISPSLRNGRDLDAWLLRVMAKDVPSDPVIVLPPPTVWHAVPNEGFTGTQPAGSLMAATAAAIIKETQAADDDLEIGGQPPEVAPCILTGAPGEDAEDCTTHDHETEEAGGEDVPNEETEGGQPAGSLQAAVAAYVEKVRQEQPAAEVVVDAETGELIPREINGFVIHQRAKDGYVNATAMCKAAGKELKHYTENDRSRKFVGVFSRSVGIPTDLLVKTITSGPNANRGTWVHPRVAINIAQWCSPEFDVAVSGWVEEWLTTGKAPAAPVLDISDPHSMMVWLNQASTLALHKIAENQKLTIALADTRQTLDATTHELVQAQEDLDVKEEQLELAVRCNATSKYRPSHPFPVAGDGMAPYSFQDVGMTTPQSGLPLLLRSSPAGAPRPVSRGPRFARLLASLGPVSTVLGAGNAPLRCVRPRSAGGRCAALQRLPSG